jgi:alanyl-tRNA synthetase
MRRLVRRAVRFALDLGLTGGAAAAVVPIVADTYAEVYPEVAAQREEIVAVLAKEERAFFRTVRKGLARLGKLAATGAPIAGEALFELHDTYGMPVELAVEEARRARHPLDPDWSAQYDALLEAQRERSRAGHS